MKKPQKTYCLKFYNDGLYETMVEIKRSTGIGFSEQLRRGLRLLKMKLNSGNDADK